MKIAVNSRMYERTETGVPYYIRDLYTELQKKDTENNYIFLQLDSQKTLGTTRTFSKFKNKLSNFLFDYIFSGTLARSEQVDIFHGPAHSLPFFKSKKIKYIVTIHDLVFLNIPKLYNPIFRLYHFWALRRNIKSADHIIAVSEYTKNDIIKFFKISESKISVIYSGVHNSFITAQQQHKIISEPYFLSVVTNNKRKNIESGIKALAHTHHLKNYTYIIVGPLTLEHERSLIKLAQDLGVSSQIKIFGYATEHELISLYQHASFLLYPSFWEGFGFPVLEAMILNCPVITSHNSSLPEIMPDKRWLIDPYSVESISKTINALLALEPHEKDELLRKNRSFALHFTWDKTAEKMMKVWATVHSNQ